MAFGKHIRQEKQSSSLFFKGTVVIFVGFCVLAVWMMNSSSPMPEETKRFSSIPQAKSEIREKIIDSVSFEDNPGDLPEDAIKGDDSEPQRNPEIEQTIENDRTSDGGANSNEEKTSDGGSNTNGEKTMQGDEDEEKDDEKVPVDDNKKANEKLSEKGGDEAESQEKREVELNGQSENGEGNDEVGNVKSEAEAENEKIENLIEKEGDGVESEGKREAENNSQSDNEKLIKKRGDEADSEEKKEAENNSQSEKDEGNREGGNGENGFKEDNRKTESELESDLKPDAGIEGKAKDLNVSESLPNAAQFELLKENTVQPGKWETQAAESKDEKERQETGAVSNSKDDKEGSSQSQDQTAEEQSLKGEESSKQRKDGKEKKKKKEQSNEVTGHLYNWQLCNVTAGPDYIPCLDNEEAIRKLRSTKHYEHRERHCPEDPPTCLVALPEGYKSPIRWPKSRDKIWYNNVPHTKLAVIKKHQNWLRISGEYLTFPGGGTQFKNGALHYIDFIEETIPDILWGKHSRVILDVGCGVASFGGFLFEREVLTMSLAPKDEHEAQVQLALERGIPAISAVMGTQRLPFPSAVFDVVHCARCRVPWHADGGKLLLELNRLLRPGGYFVWSATPIYQKLEEDIEIWKAMSSLTASICWNLLANKIDTVNEVGVAIYQKPTSNTCYESRRKNEPPMCDEADDPNAAWYVPMGSCLHKVPNVDDERGTEWPEEWPQRLEKVPDWLSNDVHTSFMSDTEHWKRIITKSYLTGFGIDWSNVRNVMDMKTVYGGFAAALASQQVWVMNVVPTDVPNTLPIIYERGLFGIYHDWCESFNTYPRTYDLLHADHLFSLLRKRCNLVPVMAEVDRILRPGGLIIFRDNAATLNELETMMKSLQWQIRMTYSQAQEGILCAQKTMWRPQAIS